MKKKINFIIFALILFSPLLMNCTTVIANENFENFSLTSNLIRNFQFDKFNGIELNGSSQCYGGKLKFEMLPNWEFKKENVQLRNKYQIGDKIYLYYQAALINRLNIYTNVKLSQATSKNLDQQATKFLAVHESKQKLFDLFGPSSNKYEYIICYHYDFGDDILTHNSQQNSFTGDLEMIFDIDDSPVPENLVDSQGNTHKKEFAYISISSVGVTDLNYGKMSNDMPTVTGIVPSEDKTRKLDKPKSESEEYAYKINPTLIPNSEPTIAFGEALQFQSIGSSMNPTTKDGEPIWSPEEEKSMTGARIKFNIGKISPMVYEWTSQLQYNYLRVKHKEHYKFPFSTKWSTSFSMDVKTEVVDSALHVINRYAQVEIKAVFDIYSCFTIEAEDNTMENYTLSRPEEHYDDLVWTSFVDGTTEGIITQPEGFNPFGFFDGWGTTIIIVIVAIVALFIVTKVVGPIVKAKIQRNNGFWNRPNFNTDYNYMNDQQDYYPPPDYRYRRRRRRRPPPY